MEDLQSSRPKRKPASTSSNSAKKTINPEESCQIDTSSGKKDGPQTKKKGNWALEQILIEKKDILRNQVNVLEASKQSPKWRATIYTNENDVDEDIVCDVCRDAEYDEADPAAPVGSDERIGDAIVICDKCNAGVH